MNPITHSESSMEKFGGKTEEDFEKFLKIHEKLDCSKHYYPNSKHRALTHTMFFVHEVIMVIFGSYIILSDNTKVSVKDICEQHILEDYAMKFIPTPSDFLDNLPVAPWMNNGIEDIKYIPPIIPPANKPKLDDWDNIFKTIPNPWKDRDHIGIPPWPNYPPTIVD